MYVKLSYDKRTGDWYTQDKKYCVYRGTVGWCVSDVDEDGIPDTCFPLFFAETLSDARYILATEYYNQQSSQ